MHREYRHVYYAAELKGHNNGLQFLREVDRRTGYRTRQMLVAPMVEASSGELVTVVQLINRREGHALRYAGRGKHEAVVRDAVDRGQPAAKAAERAWAL